MNPLFHKETKIRPVQYINDVEVENPLKSVVYEAYPGCDTDYDYSEQKVIISGGSGSSHSDATITPSTVLTGFIGYGASGKVVGTLANLGRYSATIDGINNTSVVLPSGTIAGGSVSLDDTIQNRLSVV